MFQTIGYPSKGPGVYHPPEPSTLVVSSLRTHSYIFQATDGYTESVSLGQFGDVFEKLLTWHPVSDVSYSGKTAKIRSDVVRYIGIHE